MIVSYEHKFAFVKTRKTAGSTIEKILYPILGDKDVCSGSSTDGTPNKNYKKDLTGHINYYDMALAYADVKDFFVFTVERNPWDKCVSAFYWHSKIKPWLTQYGFHSYLRDAVTLLPHDWNYYGNHLDKVHVFQYEELDQFIPYMNDRFKLDIDPDLIYNTRCKDGIREVKGYRDMYDDRSKEFVAKLFAKEIEEFGYEF